MKKANKKIKVRDMKPKKDAKGGRRTRTPRPTGDDDPAGRPFK